MRLSRGRMSAIDREAFRAPYPTAESRAAIAEFVGDIPLQGGHPSEAALDDVADRLGSIEAPVLLAWGALDPVFNDDFAADLAGRLPNTSLHRFADANHLVMAEADVAGVADAWLDDLLTASGESSGAGVAPDLTGGDDEPLWSALEARRDDPGTAFVDLADGREIDVLLARRAGRRGGRRPVRARAAAGDRVAMLTPPGVDLLAASTACGGPAGSPWSPTAASGCAGSGGVRGARPAWVIGPRRALSAAR